jgi:anti-sigma B factor antagonist
MTMRPPPQPADDTVRDGLTLDVVGTAPSVRVLVVGELDRRTAPQLAPCLSGLLDSGHRHVDLDLSGVTFLAAAGLTAFREAAVRAEQVGGRVRLTAVPSRVRRILELTALDTVLEVQPAHLYVQQVRTSRR